MLYLLRYDVTFHANNNYNYHRGLSKNNKIWDLYILYMYIVIWFTKNIIAFKFHKSVFYWISEITYENIYRKDVCALQIAAGYLTVVKYILTVL